LRLENDSLKEKFAHLLEQFESFVDTSFGQYLNPDLEQEIKGLRSELTLKEELIQAAKQENQQLVALLQQKCDHADEIQRLQEAAKPREDSVESSASTGSVRLQRVEELEQAVQSKNREILKYKMAYDDLTKRVQG
jgi:septal ring factor EnvC (AmiA/AmiB activator)